MAPQPGIRPGRARPAGRDEQEGQPQAHAVCRREHGAARDRGISGEGGREGVDGPEGGAGARGPADGEDGAEQRGTGKPGGRAPAGAQLSLAAPDPRVAGRGIERLRAAGIEVEVGVAADTVREQLAPYLKHRSTGRPWVVLKLAASLDGRTAAPDGTSQWITGGAARADAHQLRAESDAIVVGAGTVRADDPELTVRHVPGRSPLRVVLGTAPAGAKVLPALEHRGELEPLLEDLGSRGVLQVLVEGGASVAGAFHRAGLVDHYVLYLAPAIFGGDDARPLFAGPGIETMADLWRGTITTVTPLGGDLRLDIRPVAPSPSTGPVPVVRAAEASGPIPGTPATGAVHPPPEVS